MLKLHLTVLHLPLLLALLLEVFQRFYMPLFQRLAFYNLQKNHLLTMNLLLHDLYQN